MTQPVNEELVRYLTAAEAVVVFTGAGISTASGMPDYRGPQGVWNTRRPVYYQDFMASEEARKTYWQQKSEDWEAFGNAKPNAVHRALVRLEQAGKLAMLLTQNVDGLHAAAGNSREKLVELHGTNREVECQTCQIRHPAAPFYEAYAGEPIPPRCPCGGYYKPATISFGQSLREEDLKRAQAAVFGVDLMVALGTTLSVQPAASFTLMAARQGIPYVIINQGPTEHDGHPLVTLRLEGDVAELFPPALDAALAMQGM